MSWNKMQIGSFLTERKNRFKPAEANAMGLRRIDKIDFSGTYHLVEKRTNTDMILVKKGDLLFSGINAEKGAVAVYDSDEDALATIHYSSYVFDINKIDVEYLRWFIVSDTFKNLLKASAGSGIKTELKAKHLLPIEIFLPSINIQKKIVKSILKRHAKAIEIIKVVESQEIYLHELRKAISQEAVQGKLLNPQVEALEENKISNNKKTLQISNPGKQTSYEDASILLRQIKAEKRELIATRKRKQEKELFPISLNEIPFELPKGWVWCRLGEIVDLVSGVALGKAYKEELIEVEYLRVANVQRGYVDIRHLKKISVPKSEMVKYTLRKGDLLMVEGGDWDKVGRCAIWHGEIKQCIHQNHIFRIRFYGNISNKWAELFLNSPIARRYFESCSKQTTNLASINKTQLSNALFSLPPLSVQRSIVSKVEQLEEMITNLEEKVANCRSQAQLLLRAILRETFCNNENEYETNEMFAMAASV